MPSPFPGMNPYLERPDVWQDFHGAFLYALRGVLAAAVEPRYAVRVETHVYMRERPADRGGLLSRPDVSVFARTPHAGSGTAVLEPETQLTVEMIDPEEEFVARSLAIVSRAGNRLVTAVELLSPANKAHGDHRDHYLNKRRNTVRAGANVVELDFLRGGPRTVTGLPVCDYYAKVAKPETAPRAAIFPVRLREPLPGVPVPLRTPDPDVMIDLQAVFHAAYNEGRFDNFHYDDGELPAPLLAPADADADWAAALLARPITP